MRFEILNKAKKKKLIEKMKNFGIEKIPHLITQTGKNKYRIFSGCLSKDELLSLSRKLNIESLGLYLGKENGDFRLSVDAIHILKNQITNYIEVNNEQAEQWFLGKDIELKEKQKTREKGFVILKHNEDFIGCGKLGENIISNFLPKERRVKSS